MGRNLIGKAAIWEKGTALDISAEHLLAGYVLEQLACKLAVSEIGEKLLLKNVHALGLDAYRRGNQRRLEYCILADENPSDLKSQISVLLKNTITWEQETNIDWSFRTSESDGKITVAIMATLEEMTVPIELIIEVLPASRLQHPAKEVNLRLVMENNKTQMLPAYPSEEYLLEDLAQFIERLELVSDMEVFDRLYEVLRTTGFEGRHVQKQLQSICDEKNIVMEQSRIDMMKLYPDSKYLKKRWKSYLRRENKNEVEWQSVMQTILTFLEPLWTASQNDMIYLGSWIPELLRFLD
ncbi:MAG: hypothetical protein PUD20_04850 [bacterium]|nr:hypothetical protein [bacterium]